MPESPWKRAERRISRLLSLPKVTRVGYPGPDLANPFLAVDVKLRTRFPDWIADDVRKVGSYCKDRQLPIIVLVGPSQPDDLVVMTLRNFRQWFTSGAPAPTQEEDNS